MTRQSFHRKTSSLLFGLVDFWKMEESGGNRTGINGTVLTDNSTVTQAAGKINNAALFERANGEFLSLASGSAASFSVTGSFTIALDLYLTTKPGEMGVFAKFITATNNREYLLEINSAGNWAFFLSSGGVNTTTVSVTGPATGVWTHCVAWHDAGAATINIQINGGTVTSNPHTGGVFSGVAPLILGAYQSGASARLDGRIDNPGFWNRVLTSGERLQLYRASLSREHPFT